MFFATGISWSDRWNESYGRRGDEGRCLLREQAMLLPSIAGPHEEEAIVEATLAALPELDAFRLQDISLPIFRPRNLSGECSVQLVHSSHQFFASGQHAALLRRCCR
jgi:hypothetical protein